MLAIGLCVTGPALAQKAGGDRTDTINPHSPRFGHPYRRGVLPTREQHALMRAWERANPRVRSPAELEKLTQGEASVLAAAAQTQLLAYNGGVNGIGVTSGTPKVYLVFWGSQWGTPGADANGNATFSGDAKGAAPYMQKWLKGLGTNGELWSGTMTQYCDGAVPVGATSCPAGSSHIGYPSNGVLAGVWYDNSTAAPASATGNQIAKEAIKAAAHFGNTTPASNRYAQYFIMSPTGTNPDKWKTQGFCAWHDYNGDTTLSGGAAPSPYGDIAFTNMPYVADQGASCGAGSVPSNAADSAIQGFSIVGGHEYAETITDQNPAGGWLNPSTGDENADICAWISAGQGATALVAMSTGSFAMQSTWSNDTNRCDISHPIFAATGGTPIAGFTYSVSGGTVSFTDTSTDSGGTISSRSWNFGDGTTSTATSPSHTYTASGIYNVSETVTDSRERKNLDCFSGDFRQRSRGKQFGRQRGI